MNPNGAKPNRTNLNRTNPDRTDPDHTDLSWDAYLDRLEVAVTELEHTLAAHGAPEWSAPEWSAPEPPTGLPPDETLARRDGLLVRMMVAAHTLEQLRENVRHQLQSLPAPRRRVAAAYAGTLGGAFDVRG